MRSYTHYDSPSVHPSIAATLLHMYRSSGNHASRSSLGGSPSCHLFWAWLRCPELGWLWLRLQPSSSFASSEKTCGSREGGKSDACDACHACDVCDTSRAPRDNSESFAIVEHVELVNQWAGSDGCQPCQLDVAPFPLFHWCSRGWVLQSGTNTGRKLQWGSGFLALSPDSLVPCAQQLHSWTVGPEARRRMNQALSTPGILQHWMQSLLRSGQHFGFRPLV